MKVTELFEKVNKKLFFRRVDNHHEKLILDGKYKLVATAGYVIYGNKNNESNQFRITAKTAKGDEIGWVNFENIDDHLEALDLVIQPAHRRKGIATEMYKFARELGNDIAPSKLQTTMGKQFWSNKDHSTGKSIGEEWNDSAAEDADGRWAMYRDGKISASKMAEWLYSSRTHKSTKEEKLKSAYGAIAQQQNTSKLISSKQADALRAALKKRFA